MLIRRMEKSIRRWVKLHLEFYEMILDCICDGLNPICEFYKVFWIIDVIKLDDLFSFLFSSFKIKKLI
jgi:hypothetical protein